MHVQTEIMCYQTFSQDFQDVVVQVICKLALQGQASDIIATMRSASCSPLSIANSRMSRATSIEDDKNESNDENIDGEEALQRFAEGSIT